MRSGRPTPLGAVARGLAAGLAGTAVMTALQSLAGNRQSSGDSGEQTWQDAPAPAQVGRRVLKGVYRQDVGADKIPILTHGIHVAYGTAWGAIYGLVQETVRANPIMLGLVFGTGVWGMAYAQLVPMRIYKPPWEYPPQELALDLSYHLAYGLGVAGAYRALEET